MNMHNLKPLYRDRRIINEIFRLKIMKHNWDLKFFFFMTQFKLANVITKFVFVTLLVIAMLHMENIIYV